jgi:hypothetical protein
MEIKMSTYSYGKSYWCVKTPLSPDGEIYVHADAVEFKDGCLVLVGSKGVNLAFASGQWRACFAASCLDGHAIAVEHWKGEIAR